MFGLLVFLSLVLVGFWLFAAAVLGTYRPRMIVKEIREFLAEFFDFSAAAPAPALARVAYRSRRYGIRRGKALATCNSGELMRIHLDEHPPGVTVRRRVNRLTSA